MENVSIREIESLIKEEAQAVAEENSVNEIISGAGLVSFYRWLSPLGKIVNNIDIGDDSTLPGSLKGIISWARENNWIQTTFELSKKKKKKKKKPKPNTPTPPRSNPPSNYQTNSKVWPNI